MIKRKFHCKKCGQLVGQYQIKDNGVGISVSKYCHNYCSNCGKKVDVKNFEETLENHTQEMLYTKEQLKSIMKYWDKKNDYE